MTAAELWQLCPLRAEIRENARMIRMMEEEYNTIRSPGLDRMPRSGKLPGSPVESAAMRGTVNIRELRELRRRQSYCLKERSRLYSYIDRIRDSHLRRMMLWRFGEHLTWEEVAGRIGCSASPDSCRKQCERYIATHGGKARPGKNLSRDDPPKTRMVEPKNEKKIVLFVRLFCAIIYNG